MSAPAYADLGKAARDVFRSGYAYNRAKAEISTSLLENLSMLSDAGVCLKTFKAAGSIMLKYKSNGYGDFSGKVSSEGPLVAEWYGAGIITENVDLAAGYSMNLADSFHSLSFAAKFHNPWLHVTGALTKDLDRSVDLVSTICLKYNNMHVGYQTGFDTNSSTVTRNNLALAYEEEQYGVHFRCIQIPREFGLSMYSKVSDNMKLGMDAKFAGKEDTRLWFCGAGFLYNLDETTKLRMKMDSNLQLGTSLQLNLQEKTTLTLAFSLDLPNPKSGDHKVGMGVSFEF